MGNFLAELKRRHVYRVAVAYVVLAWLLLQVVNNLAPALRLPDWTATLVVVLLLVGFPITLLATWARELAPADSGSPKTAVAKLDYALIGALAVVIGLISYQQLAPSQIARPAESEESGVAAARAAAASRVGTISVAVLPFANLSTDPEQEFFSDGMTEEITAVLAKIPDLRVVARTSAFQFKDQNRDVQAIAQALKATHLIEGSVRRAGTRMRITAQLINADNGASIWAETYDREFADVFAIQEEIARAIAGALRMPLNLPQLVSSRTSNVGIYEQYLRAKILFTARTQEAVQEVAAVTTRDPNFAPGWALWAQMNIGGITLVTRGAATVPEEFRRAMGLPPGTGAISEEEARRSVAFLSGNVEMAAKKAIELDPSLPGGYAVLGTLQDRRGKWTEAEKLILQALERDPDNPEALGAYRGMLAGAGRLKDAVPISVQLRTLEPFAPISNIAHANLVRFAGQSAAGIAILEALSPNTLTYNRNVFLATAYAAQGEYARAADTLLLIRVQVPQEQAEAAARLLRSAPTKVNAPADLPVFNNELNFVYAHVGAMERVMEYYEHQLRIGSVQGTVRLWDPVYAPLRKTDRFKKFVRDVGLVDYWRARGWADLCRPVGADDFVCD
jgi:TolB-like protein